MEEYFSIISPLLAFQRIVIANRLIVAPSQGRTRVCMQDSLSYFLFHIVILFSYFLFLFCFRFEMDGILNLVFAVSEVFLFLFFLFFLNRSYEAFKLKEHLDYAFFGNFVGRGFFQEKHLFSIAMRN